MRRHLAIPSLLGVVLAACITDPITTTDPIVAVAADTWSGGWLDLSSPSFTGANSLPIVTMGADTLDTRSLGADAVQVLVPDTNGTVTMAVGLRAGGRTVVQVRVHGAITAGDGPSLDPGGELVPWPGNGNPTALGFRDHHLVVVDLRSGTVSQPLTPDTALGCWENWLPIPAADDPGLVTVAQTFTAGPCSLLAIPATSSAAPPDTGPNLGGYSAVHLGRGKWLVADKGDTLAVYTRLGSGGFSRSTAWSNWGYGMGFTVSPRGDRVLPTNFYENWSDANGIPVFDVASARLAYAVNLTVSQAAAFTADGDTLLVAGDSADLYLLLSVDAATGVPFARAVLPNSGQSVAVDPARPWVYVALVADTGPPAVEVLDRATLRQVAVLRPSRSLVASFPSPMSWYAFFPTFVSDLGARRLYLTFMTVPNYVVEYELMP